MAFRRTLQEKINRMQEKRKLKDIFSKTTELTDFLAMHDKKVRGAESLSESQDSADSGDNYSINEDQEIPDDSCSTYESA